jgi:hypothetical protein
MGTEWVRHPSWRSSRLRGGSISNTGRLFRKGKAPISAKLAGIFERLGCSAQCWHKQLQKLRSVQLLGRFFAACRVKLREIGERLGVRCLANLAGCPAR